MSRTDFGATANPKLDGYRTASSAGGNAWQTGAPWSSEKPWGPTVDRGEAAQRQIVRGVVAGGAPDGEVRDGAPAETSLQTPIAPKGRPGQSSEQKFIESYFPNGSLMDPILVEGRGAGNSPEFEVSDRL